MKKPIAVVVAFLVFVSVFTANSQEMQNPNGKRMEFPFQLRSGMTLIEAADQMEPHFAHRGSMNIASAVYKRFILHEPEDSLYFDGVGPVTSLQYVFFRDTLFEVWLNFPKHGMITIDTARFVRSYSYKSGYYQVSTLVLMDSSFAMVISPRKDDPSIDFIDMEIQDHMIQYRRNLERQFAEDSVVIVVSAASGMSSLPGRVIRGDEKWLLSPLCLGERVTFEELKTTIEFKGIGVRKSHRGEELTTKNATIFLTVDHNGLKREIAISADTDRPCSSCQCVGIAEDLPNWLVCASVFKKISNTYQILVNINQSAEL